MSRTLTALSRRIWRHNAGSAALEFALTAPLLLLLLTSLIEAAHATLLRHDLGMALQTAARTAMINPSMDSASLESVIADQLENANSNEVTVTISDGSIHGHDNRTIALSYDMESMIGSLWDDATIPISVETTVPLLP